MASFTTILDACESEYRTVLEAAAETIAQLRACGGNANPATTTPATTTPAAARARQARDLLTQATELVKQMDTEVRSSSTADAAGKKTLLARVAEHKAAIASHRMELERANEQANRSALLGGKSIQQRERMMDANDQLLRQNEVIAQAQRTVADTEDVGHTIAQELQQNRAKIEGTQERVTEFKDVTDKAKTFVKRMNDREKCHVS